MNVSIVVGNITMREFDELQDELIGFDLIKEYEPLLPEGLWRRLVSKGGRVVNLVLRNSKTLQGLIVTDHKDNLVRLLVDMNYDCMRHLNIITLDDGNRVEGKVNIARFYYLHGEQKTLEMFHIEDEELRLRLAKMFHESFNEYR